MKAVAALGAAVVAAAAAVLAPTLAGRTGHGGAAAGEPISATATISPREQLFGDRVHARLVVRVDGERVRADDVSIHARFAPYAPLGPVRLVRGARSLRLDADLVCLARACVPRAPERPVVLAAATVAFRDGGRRRTASVAWPPLLVASRLSPADLRRPVLRERGAPPPVRARVDPQVLGWALAGAAGLLLLLAGSAVARRLATGAARVDGLRPERVPELRRALANVERLAGEGEEARRAALDRLARTLAEAGLARLAPEARVLAWSAATPSAEPMRRLAAEIEGALAGEAAA